jgi:hypothetical protein
MLKRSESLMSNYRRYPFVTFCLCQGCPVTGPILCIRLLNFSICQIEYHGGFKPDAIDAAADGTDGHVVANSAAATVGASVTPFIGT